jgi:hypothetical protein
MAGYPVQRRRPPVIMREAARRQARDSGTLSGTSAEEEQMTGKIMPLRERDTSTVQAAADAFLSSPRYANPNTRRGYTGVLDRLLAGLGASRRLRSAGRSWPGCWSSSGGSAPRRPGTATAAPWPPGCPGAPPKDRPPRSCRPAPNGAASTSTPPAPCPARRSTGRFPAATFRCGRRPCGGCSTRLPPAPARCWR